MGFKRTTPDMSIRCAKLRKVSPCMGCTDRAVGCHGKCEKYIAYKAAGLADFKKRKEHYIAESRVERYVCDSKTRVLKRQGRWKGDGYK